MDLEVREITDDRFEAIIEDTRPSQVNALRRSLYGDVPKLAIEDVTVYDNTSGLFDEVVAHRLGMIPIPTDPDGFNMRPECTCGGEGCPNCIVIYTLSKEGPGTVYSGDLMPQDEELEVPDAEIPIVHLLENQRLMLEAVAQLGTGDRHVKYSPVVAPTFKQWPVFVVEQDGEEEPFDVETVCEDHLALRGTDVEVEIQSTDECDACAKETDGTVRVDGRHDKVIFSFETDGSMTARQAMKAALQDIQARLETFEDHLEDLD